MSFIPRSRRGDLRMHHRLGADYSDHVIYAEGVNSAEAVAAPVGAGGAVFHHCRTLHSSGPNRAGPYASLFRDSVGNIYGITPGGGTSNGGTAFELSPPAIAGNRWTEKVLWSFGNGTDGAGPEASLIMDSGNLYGTTTFGGLYDDHKALNRNPGGTAFKLTPPAGAGNWTETVLWNFGYTANNGKVIDGRAPERSLRLVGGNLYGTATGGGRCSRRRDRIQAESTFRHREHLD